MVPRVQGWTIMYPQHHRPNPPAIGDPQFRRALVQAIDRQQMADSIQFGMVPIAHSFINPQEPEYRDIEPSIVRYEYDLRRATQIIEEIGYAKGPDGVYRDPGTQRLALEVRTTTVLDIHQKTFLPVVDYWQRLGVAVDPVVLPPQRAVDAELRATFPTFEILRNPTGPSRLGAFHSSQVRLPETNWRGANYMRYQNAEWDALLHRFFTTIPLGERNRVLAQSIHHMTDRLIMMGLFYDTATLMVGHRMQNVAVGGQRSLATWNVHDWDLK